MNRILPLLKKDVQHLAPHMAVLWLVMALACYSDGALASSIPLAARTILQFLLVMAPLLCSALVVLAIQQESLIGDRQYWLTRPFTWRDLLVSKLLFILLAVNLPLFLLQAAGMALHGLPPFAHLAELLWRQVFFTAFLVILPAALAVITRAPGHALATVLLTAAGWFLAVETVGPFISAGPSWAAWIATSSVAILSLSFGTGIVVLQYRRRRPAVPRALFASLMLLSIPASTLTYAAAWVVQPWLSTRRIAPAEFQISFDPRNGQPPDYKPRIPGFEHLEIPIRATGLANAGELVVNRLRFTPSLPTLTFDRGGWVPDNAIHDVAGGAGWLRLFVESNAYARLAREPIDLRGTADLALFVHIQTVRYQLDPIQVAGLGACGSYGGGCVTAQPRSSVEVYQDGVHFSSLVSPAETYSPFPAAYLLNPVRQIAAGTGTFVVRKPVAWFARTFEFRNIRLADYVR